MCNNDDRCTCKCALTKEKIYKYSTNIPYIADIFKYGYILNSRGSYVRQHHECCNYYLTMYIS